MIDKEGDLIIMVEIDLSVQFEEHGVFTCNRNSAIGYKVTDLLNKIFVNRLTLIPSGIIYFTR